MISDVEEEYIGIFRDFVKQVGALRKKLLAVKRKLATAEASADVLLEQTAGLKKRLSETKANTKRRLREHDAYILQQERARVARIAKKIARGE